MRGTIGARGYAVLRGKIHAELDRLLSGTYTDPDNARLAKLLRKHRESVLTFLDHDAVGATNHLAGREDHPAVIARKVSAGNRTEAGAETHAVLASVLRTLRRQGRPILDRATSWSSTTFLPPKGPRPCEESRRLLKSCTPSYPHSPGDQIRAGYAVEGGFVYEHRDPQFGQLQLILVGKFGSRRSKSRSGVDRILEAHHVRLYSTSEVDRLVEEIEPTAKDHPGAVGGAD